MTIAPTDVSTRPELTIEAIPAVLSVKDLQRILGISRPTAYEVAYQCRPIRIGRLMRVRAQDFAAWLEAQR